MNWISQRESQEGGWGAQVGTDDHCWCGSCLSDPAGQICVECQIGSNVSEGRWRGGGGGFCMGTRERLLVWGADAVIVESQAHMDQTPLSPSCEWQARRQTLRQLQRHNRALQEHSNSHLHGPSQLSLKAQYCRSSQCRQCSCCCWQTDTQGSAKRCQRHLPAFRELASA